MRTSYRGWLIGAGTVFVAVIGFVVVLAVALAPAPHFSAAEQQFLTHVHDNAYTWPSDAELVSEGHQVCQLLNSNGGDEDALEEPRLWGRGPDPMPDFMKSYRSLEQRHELTLAATRNFCDQYTLYIGNVPI
jgi:hypothetical protein